MVGRWAEAARGGAGGPAPGSQAPSPSWIVMRPCPPMGHSPNPWQHTPSHSSLCFQTFAPAGADFSVDFSLTNN